MAAKTADTHYRESMGSLTLHIAYFSNIDDADTWASGIQGVVSYWGQLHTAPDATSDVGLAISASSLTGDFTMWLGDTDKAGTIYVVAKN